LLRFQADPFAHVRRQVPQADALSLQLGQEVHRIEVDELHLSQIKRDEGLQIGQLHLQALHVR
jgi:hypothetical protein